MLRMFREHEVRKVDSLCGLWDFQAVNGAQDIGKPPDVYSAKACVPGCWEQMPGYENYRGKAWYRRHVDLRDGEGALRLVFGGVSHTTRVFIDGKEAGGHYDAYTPFDVIVSGLAPGRHELAVEVDNSFGPESALHRESDYFTYGGITRPVEVHILPETWIRSISAIPARQGERWKLDLKIKICNLSEKPLKRSLAARIGEKGAVRFDEISLPPLRTVEIEGAVEDLDVNPWSPESPELYMMSAELLSDGVPCDDLKDRIGFRTVEVEGKKLLLNGAPIRLRGYNRHEDHPQFGCALPVDAMMCDLKIMEDLGCNFVRTSHYPNDMRFLDLCDALGFCVWEESHYRNVPFDHPRFREQTETCTREMIGWHSSRPCIIMWGCLNESASDTKQGYEIHSWLLGLMKELDPSRPVTYATNRTDNDLCSGLADIVSWNRYVGWYGLSIQDIASELEKNLQWLHSEASGGGAGKPVILSEFGAGALPGYRHPHRAKWTEEYQRDLLDEALRVYTEHPDVTGVAIWQFCDIRITRDFWQNRPRTMNNKGTVDEYRRPKLAYDVVKKRFRGN